MSNPPALDLLSVTQVAHELKKPARTVHHMIATGRIAATKVGDGRTSAYVITRTELDRLLAQRAEKASA